MVFHLYMVGLIFVSQFMDHVAKKMWLLAFADTILALGSLYYGRKAQVRGWD